MNHPIPEEEEHLLTAVREHLAKVDQEPRATEQRPNYDKQLVELRDEIAEARLEDVPALFAQMERLSGLAARRADVQSVPVDRRVPYFAHMRLKEEGKVRDILIGRTTHIDARSGVRIVDWRHAPVSQLYYRYSEGAFYEETFGAREVEGEVLVRRTVTIEDGTLVRIQAPQGIFVRLSQEPYAWIHRQGRAAELAGGQGTATRPTTRGTLGFDRQGGAEAEQRANRHLSEITALLDPRQFELISAPDSGIVVIQGGAGSGKTTIGLHRMAFLSYRDKHRFAPDRMLVITYGIGLCSYISEVLPALGVEGVKVKTFADWAEAQRRHVIPWLKKDYEEDTPAVVTRLKKHPALLKLLTERAKRYLLTPRAARTSRVVVNLWAEVLTDLPALRAALDAYGYAPLSERELQQAHRWCTERCWAALELDPHDREQQHDDDEKEGGEEDPGRPDIGIDGLQIDADQVLLDREDDALLLRLFQLVVGPLRKGKHALVYEHLFVDEAQDLSPVELQVLLETTSRTRSITLAGDTAQKLYMDNGFRDWRTVLNELGLSSTDIEPLQIAYRSTREVLVFARDVLGPLADPVMPVATRTGAPVEAHCFPQTGAAVAFLAEALRPLFNHEPRATVGILARFAEQADAYYEGLKRSDVPYLRRVRAQDFSFRPGIDVTEVRQVKGLEFDYVIIVDANASVFPDTDEARHLLHIAATRAAHQLWVVITGKPSPLISKALLEGGGIA